jgi:hydrogenase nickel incorporation protein HypA/HybF
VHELSVCQSLLSQVEDIAGENSAQRVLLVVLGVGPLSGVEPELLKQAYPIAAAGSVAEGSELAIESRPVRVACSQCGCESDASSNRLVCSHCGNWQTRLVSGDELLLLRIEFEREESYV